MSEQKRHVALPEVLTFAMVLVASQHLAKLLLPFEWLDAWGGWHIIGVSALAGLLYFGVMWLARSRIAARHESPYA